MQSAIDFWLLFSAIGGIGAALIAGAILYVRNKEK